MIIERSPQMTIMNYDLDKIVKDTHPLKKVEKTVSFKKTALGFKELEKTTGRNGYGLEVGIKSLLLQFYYDLSDREIEDRLRYDLAFRWFCGFVVDDETPDHTYFCRIRKNLGTARIGLIFRKINRKAQDKGIMGVLQNFRETHQKQLISDIFYATNFQTKTKYINVFSGVP